jgi:hypothetical protein
MKTRTGPAPTAGPDAINQTPGDHQGQDGGYPARWRGEWELLREVGVLIDAAAGLLARAALEETLDTDVVLHSVGLLEKSARYLAAVAS